MIKAIIVGIIILLLAFVSEAKTIKIAVLDTGLPTNFEKLKICEIWNFTDDESIHDLHGHGTNISNIIEKYSGNSDYCQVIIKVFGKNGDNGRTTIKALKFLITRDDIKMVNYSGGGEIYIKEEAILIKKLLDQKKVIVVAAGNESSDLNKNCNYYPACIDKRIAVVGNGKNSKLKAQTSNYGDKVIRYWADGTNVCGGGVCLTGTSQATAIISGCIINVVSNVRNPAGNYDEAIRVTAEQMYYYNGIHLMVEKKINHFSERVPDVYKRSIQNIVPILDIIMQQRIQYRKEF